MNFELKENILLAPYTTLKIGGRARLFADADSENILEILKFAHNEKLPICVLGAGSNVLVPSEGLDALVIHFNSAKAKIILSGNKLVCDAALPLGKLVNFAAKHSLAGFDFLAGIPATVGGAVFMNAGLGGAEKKEISDVFLSAEIIDENLELKTFSKNEMKFSYRRSVLQEGKYILKKAIFDASKKEDALSIQSKIKEKLLARKLREPENNKTAGSVFKAVQNEPAAKFIDSAGLKGLRVGDAMVSLKHANWIENLGNASSDDVLKLIKLVQEKVSEKHSIKLETEVRLLEAITLCSGLVYVIKNGL